MGLIDKIPTPNPSEKALRVWVPSEKIVPNQEPTVGVTKYRDFKMHPTPNRAEGYAGYVFAGCGDPVGSGGPLDQSWVPYDFVKHRTEVERYTPFDTGEETEDVDYPSVCRWIDFSANYGAPRSQSTIDMSGKSGTVIIPRWIVRRSMVKGQTLKTRVKVRKFLSEIPWPESAIESDEPMPTEIPWDLEANFGSTGPCLHDEKTIPGQGSAYAVISNAGNPESASGSDNRSQYVPKTNHLRWQDFVTNEVKWVEPRLFLRIERTYIARRMPEESLLV